MVMVSSSLALAYVGSNRRTVFLSYRGHFPLGPYVERLGEGVPNLAWNLYFQASAKGDPRQRVRINVGATFVSMALKETVVTELKKTSRAYFGT
ncbi:hypothetical protein CY34DRAFT_802273 [Suillus luteus UH-Slu-Lm8-n1]|uniref:Uncharacterized protein n=1 Tax=Suillus luteus UH-Slu-Lm8-n1 TaxID=930992 RepID=A0A0D0BFA5_9AGAM|nr:hypothetical protein CY34DRAFT_802273 [Suillus luteus UH-Slu-Lm8-n1]